MPMDSCEFGFKYGVMLVPEIRGCKFLGGSRYKTSEEMQDHLQRMQAGLRAYIGTLYVIRFDNAKETRSDTIQRFLNSQGTSSEFSSPHVHEELGLVERAWQTIERTAVAALRHAPNGCSLDKWFDAMQYGGMTDMKIARARPRCDDLIISNEQRLTGKVPDYSLFIPFFCPVRFFLDPEQRSNKWDEKARAGWYIGPSPENSTKPYVWDGYAHATAGAGMQICPACLYLRYECLG